jgi:nucleotide-binding universal stress UspA family protein
MALFSESGSFLFFFAYHTRPLRFRQVVILHPVSGAGQIVRPASSDFPIRGLRAIMGSDSELSVRGSSGTQMGGLQSSMSSTSRVLICSIGTKRQEATLRFGLEVVKALSAEAVLFGIVGKKRGLETLKPIFDQAASELINTDVPVEVRLEVGQAEDLILAEIEGSAYDLVAIGALGGKRSRRVPFNSVGMRIIERTEGSVLLIKGDRSSLSRVLICASGAEHGHLSVWAGTALACGAGARATVLHVVDAMPSMYAGLERMEETLAELLQSDTDKAKELRWAAQVVKAGCDVSELKLRRGIVVDEILDEGQAGDYDVIVLGSSRYPGGLVRVLMGDVTREVINRAQRPVLVVRPVR